MPPTKPAPASTPARVIGRSAAPQPAGTRRGLSLRPAGENRPIQIEGIQLAVGDVVLRMPFTGTHHYRISEIVSTSAPYINARCTDLLHPDLPATTQRFGSSNTLELLIAGAKYDKAKDNPELLKPGHPYQIWNGQAEEAATS